MSIRLGICPKGHWLDVYSCPECEGDGYIQTEYFDGIEFFWDYGECPNCNGTGELYFCDECGKHF